MAITDVILAYDQERLFETTAHAIYANPQTEYSRRRSEHQTGSGLPGDDGRRSRSWDNVYDLIAIIHLIDFKLVEPERLSHAREHLLKMVEMSRMNWELVNQETDDRNELVPNPNQKSVIPGLMVDEQRREAWQRFLNEAEDILEGETLIPFWRDGFQEGINLKRFFTEPGDFDLVLWLQGTGAFPYLEKGDRTDPQLWNEFQRIFRGGFLGFAIRVN